MANNEQASGPKYAYDEWVETLDVPLYRSFYIEDVRTLELGFWKERDCATAFIQLNGQEGISEARVTEIPPGEELPPYKMAIDEVVYVASGQGLTTAWTNPGEGKRTFEWQAHSLFNVPANTHRQFSNARGDAPCRLLHYNYLPLAMSVVPEPDFFLENPYRRASGSADLDFSEAKEVHNGEGMKWISSRKEAVYWNGSFFPDMLAWEKLDGHDARGAGGKTVRIQFANSEMSSHMSVFPARTYKKAHRHGPGRVIVIPGGEGYSVMWPEGEEKQVMHWQEGSLIVPPNRWFHQHFNLGERPARYLAFHPPMQFHGYQDKVQDRVRDQIEYPDEDPWIREYFKRQLADRGLSSAMPEAAYTDHDYQWQSHSERQE